MKSVAGAVPQNTVPVCQLDGCDRPITHRNRKYCSRHRYLADIDYIQDLWDRPDVRAVREAIRQQNELEHLMTPLRRVEVVLSDAERATMTLRSFLSTLPTPSRLSSFQQEAKEAWASFHKGDSEPLDLFIRRHLIRLKNKNGTVPDKLRERVIALLDCCFDPVPFYDPGEWLLYNQSVWDEVIGLVRTYFKMTGSVEYALSGDDQSPRANYRKKLPGATGLAWQVLMWDEAGSKTLLNLVEEYLETEGHEASKLLGYAEKKPGAFIDDDSDHSLAQFEAREAARQQVEALPRLIEKARFSMTERMVYDYDARVGTEFDSIEEATKAAAHALGDKPSTVRGLRKKYRDKLNLAAGA